MSNSVYLYVWFYIYLYLYLSTYIHSWLSVYHSPSIHSSICVSTTASSPDSSFFPTLIFSLSSFSPRHFHFFRISLELCFPTSFFSSSVTHLPPRIYMPFHLPSRSWNTASPLRLQCLSPGFPSSLGDTCTLVGCPPTRVRVAMATQGTSVWNIVARTFSPHAVTFTCNHTLPASTSTHLLSRLP